MAAALNLAKRGLEVTLLERSEVLGGNARSVCCKAVAGRCQSCGGCLVSDYLAALRGAPIDVRLKTTLRRVTPAAHGFALFIPDCPDGPLSAHAVILATGFDHIDARTKGPYGYGLLPQVTTGEEMERRLRERGQAAYDGLDIHKVAFIQCVGSRDEHAGRGYCSQVCCRYGLRLARLLHSRHPLAEITIFKMDIQACGRDFDETWQALPNEGIRLVAGLPAIVRRSLSEPGRVAFLYDNILNGQFVEDAFDLVVLATGIQPRQGAAAIAEMLGIDQDDYGFFATGADDASTLAPGVFVAGCCQAPRSIAESIAHAHQAAEACYRHLQQRLP
jgi:heterodisulfide reductase subunit A